jgi:hypothetical protein
MNAQSTPRLALRALNDSRRGDPLAYLSLRYTLDSLASLKNVWAQNIAPEIVRRRPGPGFLESKQFKQLGENDHPEFRDVVRPGGPEALAEVALLDACSRAGNAFKPADEVYSYHFSKRNSVEGAFVPYFQLFSARQAKIGEMCAQRPRDWVLYADIKQFYPSITSAKAMKAWERACKESELDARWREFGGLLLKRQFNFKKGLQVGPSFSHLIANLVLRDLDQAMAKAFPGRYFRYVDDFAFIVPPKSKRKTTSLLRTHLKLLGLRLHPKKIHWIGAKKWRENAPYQHYDYDDEPVGDERWMHFIDHVKCYLMARPAMQERVSNAFREAGLRLPLPRFTAEMMARSYNDRFKRRLASNEFAATLKKLSPNELVREGLSLRKHYAKQFESAWGSFVSSKGPIRKWKLSKVRYLLGRMLLIGSNDQVGEIHGMIHEETEISEYAAMFAVLLTGNADLLLPFGWKVAASAGQVLAAASIPVTCKSIGWKSEHVEAYTTLRLAGVTVEVKLPRRLNSDRRIQAVVGNRDKKAWAEMPYSFYRELSALIGNKNLQDHQTLLKTPADPDERWEVFADELLRLEPT